MTSADIAERARALHQGSLVIDSHSGLMTDVARRRMNGEQGTLLNVHVPRLRAGGVDVVGLRIGGDTISPLLYKTDRHLKVALWTLEITYQEVAESYGEFVIATTVSEMRQAKREGKIAGFLVLEGARPIEDRLELLQLFYRLGVRRFQLTWNFRNGVADGCGEERAGGGVSVFGEEVIREVERLGMILDLSHSSESSFWSALEHHGGPVFVTHANARSLCDHPRNLRDEQIRAIADTGGVVGVALIGHFITEDNEPTIARLVDHIDHMVELVGIDHVGLGCDYTNEHPDLRGAGRAAYPGLYPKDFVTPKFPPGLTSHDETGNLTVELVRRGYSDNDVSKILGENYLRTFERVLGS